MRAPFAAEVAGKRKTCSAENAERDGGLWQLPASFACFAAASSGSLRNGQFISVSYRTADAVVLLSRLAHPANEDFPVVVAQEGVEFNWRRKLCTIPVDHEYAPEAIY